MVNTNKLKKEIARKEEELLQEFKEELLSMNKEEFEEYFKGLIEKYYKVLFTFQDNYSKYYEDSNKQYDTTIKLVKDLVGFQYNNLTNYENLERLKQAEHIAFTQMNELHSIEYSYSNIIYSNFSQELILINNTLSSLVELYNKNPSEDVIDVITSVFNPDLAIIIRTIKKLPVHDNLTDFIEPVVYKKKHFKDKANRPEEDIESFTFTVPPLSCYIPQLLEEFNSILEDLKVILPEDNIVAFENKLNASEELEELQLLLTTSPDVPKEDIYETVAFIGYAQEESNKKYLCNIINSWS